MQPGLHGSPLTGGLPPGNTEHLRRLALGETAKEFKLNQLHTLRVQLPELLKRFFKSEHIHVETTLRHLQRRKRHPAPIPTPLVPSFAPGMIDQHLPHGTRCQDEVRAPILELKIGIRRELHPSLVDKRSRLKRVTDRLRPELRSSDPTQLLIDLWCEVRSVHCAYLTLRLT